MIKKLGWSFVVFLGLVFMSLTAEVWSNNQPLVMRYQGEFYWPLFKDYHPKEFGVTDLMVVPYEELSEAEGSWALWPINRWSPYAMNKAVQSYPSPPSGKNWMGTDDRGRDVTARLLYGFRYSIIYSVLVWFGCVVLATLFGTTMGFLGGRVDIYGQRVVEILSTMPSLFLLIFLISVFGANMFILVLVSCALGWIGLSYYMRGEALRTRGLEFVEAAESFGASKWRIITKHIIPNILNPIITFTPFLIAGNIVGLAALEYLGFGLPPPSPSWGELLRQGQTYFRSAWWLGLFPSFAIFVVLFSVTLIGERVRILFDPQKRFNV